MADENVDLHFIAAQLGKVLDGQREANERLGKLEGAVSELQIAVAVIRTGQAAADEQLAKIVEAQLIHGGRLNIIDARLATIEREAGLVKA